MKKTQEKNNKKTQEKDFLIENPLKDFRIFQPPNYDIIIKKGEPVSVPEIFKQNLITEKIIRSKKDGIK
jgi:hypothetical protein